jgi:cytochrome c oxidase subunit 3
MTSYAKSVDEVERGEKTERDINTQGMWLFLSSEVMFFGVMFTAYIIYRRAFPQVFSDASTHLDQVLGSINTFLLLSSSFTVAMAVNSIQRNRRRLMAGFFMITILLGLAFLGVKFLEYSHEIEQNLFPGANFVYPGNQPENAKLFFSLYFLMTGWHALHMVVGISVISLVTLLGLIGRFTPEDHGPVEIAGLFWHFVDIVWLFIFPLLYLVA